MDTLTNEIKTILGSNYDNEDQTVIQLLIIRYTNIAVNESNRKETDALLKPYIQEAVIEAYQRRGREGSSSNSEGDISDTFFDIEEKLRKDVSAIRILP